MPNHLYDLIAINEKKGRQVKMNATPLTHAQGCTVMNKLTKYPWRRLELREVL